MTDVPPPAPFDPERYRSAAAHYERGRVPYASALIRRVAEVTGLGPEHRVLDLGCGPGPLARNFAPLVREVTAIDPSAEMLAEARVLAGRRQTSASSPAAPMTSTRHWAISTWPSWAALFIGWIVWIRLSGSTG